jgi:uncharacterized integral membrane protein
MRLLFVLALLLALLVTVFAVQNNANIDVSFLFWGVAGSLALVLMITLSLGILIGVLLMLPGTVRRRLEVGELKRTVRTLEQQASRPPPSPIGGAPPETGSPAT